MRIREGGSEKDLKREDKNFSGEKQTADERKDEGVVKEKQKGERRGSQGEICGELYISSCETDSPR